MKFAAIDIGSNAVRLLLCNVIDRDGEVFFKKAELVRVPIRLGEDAFRFGSISQEKKLALAKTMKSFRLLIEVFEAVSFRACATSAMREAVNREEVVDFVAQYSGIQIEVIDGKTEAQIIYSNHIAEHLDPSQAYLYIDVGGGSTEITVFAENRIVKSQSFNIGTIRMLHHQVDKVVWEGFKDWIRQATKDFDSMVAIGSGGNINKLIKMSGKKEDKPLSSGRLRELYDLLRGLSVEDRITRLGLNPDRADVIVPAAKIFLSVMKAARIDYVVVPQIGLSDGMVHLLYEQYMSQTQLNL